MKIISYCNKIIEFSFYALFFLVPLVIASDTSELFELNKMWLTFGLALIIAAAWLTKMILHRRIWIQRTPLDIPILLFLLSQFISTIFSWDVHVSFWGYYSRFNGGLLSIITYIFLYYAFVSNLGHLGNLVNRLLFVSLLSGLVVALWGLPSHFGHDPTCFLFRQAFDVSCWTEDFQPKIRIFSTLGQPDWLAAYLAILLPISIIMFVKFIKNLPLSIFYFLLSALFYLDLLYTRARSGFLAIWLSLAFFVLTYILVTKTRLIKLSVLLIMFLSITFFIGTPFPQISKFTLEGIKAHLPTGGSKTKIENPTTLTKHTGELGGTDSGKIRAIVWRGAINIWQQHPLFGTGVETFAFSYYRHKPAAQNLTSEWNFLYNKAHNEYLNYLATTGIVGLGTYLLMIGWFIFILFKSLNPKSEARNPKQYQNSNGKNSKRFEHSNLGNSNLFRVSIFDIRILTVALLSSYLSILITNFFGFSVVITNIYLFMIPAFILILGGMINPQKQFVFPRRKIVNPSLLERQPTISQWTFIVILLFAICYLLFTLFKFWLADKNYSLGYNLNRAGEYLQANPYLRKAVQQRNEPVFKDELAVNDALLAVTLLSQKDSSTDNSLIVQANNLAQEAIDTSDQLTSRYEYNVVFWKSRTRIFYTLSQIDPQYLLLAQQAIEKAASLSPNDASISYNLGVLYGQNDDVKNGIITLENTIRLKPDYRDAYYALGLFYHDQAVDEKGKVINASMQEKAIKQMEYILNNLSHNDSPAKDALKSWK